MSTTDRAGAAPRNLTVVWLGLALAGAVCWAFLLQTGDHERAWRSLLVNFLFFTSLAGGLVTWPALVRTCNGTWHLRVERLAAAGLGFAIPSLLALVLLWMGSPWWAPWYRVRLHQGLWLNNSFLFARDLAALICFWGLAWYYQRSREKGGLPGALLLVVYSLVFSLLGFDLVMALDPQWFSNLAGGYFFMSGLYIGITAWCLLAARDPGAGPDQRHDLGKLMVAFSLMTTYLMFAHLLPFWYENLPHEIRFLVPRLNFQPWNAVSYLLLAVVYLGPLVLLLLESAKRSRRVLGSVSLLVLVGMWLERWWLVVPNFETTLRLGLSELSLAAAFLGLLGFGMSRYRRGTPEPSGEQ
jgi:hypothetical protein